MLCSNCHSEIVPNQNFCMVCGTPIYAEQETVIRPAIRATAPDDAPRTAETSPSALSDVELMREMDRRRTLKNYVADLDEEKRRERAAKRGYDTAFVIVTIMIGIGLLAILAFVLSRSSSNPNTVSSSTVSPAANSLSNAARHNPTSSNAVSNLSSNRMGNIYGDGAANMLSNGSGGDVANTMAAAGNMDLSDDGYGRVVDNRGNPTSAARATAMEECEVQNSESRSTTVRSFCDYQDCTNDATTATGKINNGETVTAYDAGVNSGIGFYWRLIKYRGKFFWIASSKLACS